TRISWERLAASAGLSFVVLARPEDAPALRGRRLPALCERSAGGDPPPRGRLPRDASLQSASTVARLGGLPGGGAADARDLCPSVSSSSPSGCSPLAAPSPSGARLWWRREAVRRRERLGPPRSPE